MNRNQRLGAAILCAAIGILAGVATAIGVFARGDGATAIATSVRGGTYEVATNGVYAYNAEQLVAEGVGWDVFTLIVAVPALLVASYFVARGSFRAMLVASGLLAYFLYMYLEYAVTWAFGPLFIVFVLIFGLSLIGIVWLGVLIAADGIQGRFSERFPRRSWVALSTGMAVLLTFLWMARIWQALNGDADAVLFGHPTMTVQALDLGLMVPVALLIAFLTWRRSDVGYVLAASFAVTFSAMSAAIFSMLISAGMYTGIWEIPPMAIFAFASIAGTLVAARMYASEESHGRAGAERSALRPTTGQAPVAAAGT